MKIRRCARVLAGRLHRKTCPRGRGRTIFGGVIHEFAELAGETMKIRGTRWHLVPRFLRRFCNEKTGCVAYRLFCLPRRLERRRKGPTRPRGLDDEQWGRAAFVLDQGGCEDFKGVHGAKAGAEAGLPISVEAQAQ